MNISHPKNKYQILIIAILFFGAGLSPALAGDFHAPPRDFLFGNHIDTHQETKLKVDKDGNPVSLSGFLYIIFTGATDEDSELPVARHPRGAGMNEECGVDVDCVKGWDIYGVPTEGDPDEGKPDGAQFLYHMGVNGDDHAVWMVNRVDIPQPGSFTHFHWIANQPPGTTTTDPRAIEVPPACDKNNAGELEDLEPFATGVTCPGWLLEIKATRSFAFEHGGEKIPVRAGIDNATHMNLVTNYEVVSGITSTR